ncbi:trypsin-like peptidase domain-containing protein [Micromonospora chersina]|uniref:trypsin-like peptidase domain-containing protein n=1 Tax=Micromonospora chersina TaxID=47854 RepID=UPI003403850F
MTHDAGPVPHRIAKLIVSGSAGSGGRRGSGYRISDSLVLTAEHVVAGVSHLEVRFNAEQVDEWSVGATVCFRDVDDDLAVLRLGLPITAARLAPPRVGRIGDRAAELEVHAVGYPWWKRRKDASGRSFRDSYHLVGRAATLSDLGTGRLEITVAVPPADDPTGSPWAAMSGAAVWTDGHLVGVITEQHWPEGLGRLTAVRIDKYLDKGGSRQDEFASLLSIACPADALVDVLAEQASAKPTGAGWPTKPAITTRAVDAQFTGRAWLVAEIEAFMGTNDRGYFFLEGDACSGKTEFARYFATMGATQRPSHFTDFSYAARTAEGAVGNLARQIINRWRLDAFPQDGPPPNAPDLSAWLYAVAEAAAARADRSIDHRVVLVVDGLDEATECLSKSLPLGLPDNLPTNVFIVATARTGALSHLPHATPYIVCNLADWPVNDGVDRRAFVHRAVRRPELAARLRVAGLSPDDFVTAVLNRCEDNWLYLRHLVDEIEQGTRDPREVDRLPTRVDDYYYNNLRTLRDDYAGVPWLAPVLATLAAAREPLTAAILATLVGTDDVDGVQAFLCGRFRSFCSIWPGGELDGDQRFGPRHSSLRYFLNGATPPSIGQPRTFHDMQADIRSARRTADRTICDRYVAAWGGHESRFAALAAAPDLAALDGGYGRQWLPHHLVAAGRTGELHDLLSYCTESGNLWYAVHDGRGEVSQYLDHVRLARRQILPDPTGPDPHAVALRIRYDLVEASLVSGAANVPPALLGWLTGRRVWSPSRALHHVTRLPEEPARAAALAAIAKHLPGSLLPEALSVALGIRGESERVAALRALIPHLPVDRLETVADAVETLHHRYPQGAVKVATALIPRLPAGRRMTAFFRNEPAYRALVAAEDDQPDEALTAVEELDIDCDEILAAIVSKLPTAAFDRIVQILRTSGSDNRDQTLVALARHGPPNRLTELLNLAADQTPTADARPSVFARIIKAAGGRFLPEQLPAVLSFVTHLRWHNKEALAALAPYLSDTLARQALASLRPQRGSGSWKDYESLRSKFETTAAIVALTDRLSDDEAVAVIRAHIASFDADDRGTYINHTDLAIVMPNEPGTEVEVPVPHDCQLALIASHLPPDTLRRTVRSVCLFLITELSEEWQDVYSSALSHLAPWLSDDLVREAFSVATHTAAPRPEARQTILSILAPHLSDELLREAVTRIVPRSAEVQFFSAIAALERQLPLARRELAGRRALDTVRRAGRGRPAVQAIQAVAPGLTPVLASEALELVRDRQGNAGFIHTTKAVDALSPYLPVQSLPAALDTVMRDHLIDDDDIKYMPQLLQRLGHDDPAGTLRTVFRLPEPRLRSHRSAEWLTGLADYLSPSLAAEALAVARTFKESVSRRVLAALVPRLAEPARSEVVREALGLLAASPANLTERLRIIGTLLSASATPDVVAAARDLLAEPETAKATWYVDSWNACLHFLANLPLELLEDGVAFAKARHYRYPFEAIRSMAFKMSDDLLAETVAYLESAGWDGAPGDNQRQALALIAVARRFPNDRGQRDGILSRLLDREIRWGWWTVSGPILVELIPLLPAAARSRTVATAIEAALHSPCTADELMNTQELVRILDPSELEQVTASLDAVVDHRGRAQIAAAVLDRAKELPATSQAVTPMVILRDTTGTDRADLFTVIAAGAWWLRREHGVRCIEEVMEAAFDVIDWWR